MYLCIVIIEGSFSANRCIESQLKEGLRLPSVRASRIIITRKRWKGNRRAYKVVYIDKKNRQVV